MAFLFEHVNFSSVYIIVETRNFWKRKYEMNILDIYPDIENAPVEIRLSRAKAPDTPPEILERLSRDSFWFVRDLVASNSHTPIPSLYLLMEDPDFRIRYDANKTLNAVQSKLIDRNPSLESQIYAAIQKTEEHKFDVSDKSLCR